MSGHHTRKHARMHTHACAHTCMPMHTLMCTHTHTHTHTHAHTHTHKQTHTQTNTQTNKQLQRKKTRKKRKWREESLLHANRNKATVVEKHLWCYACLSLGTLVSPEHSTWKRLDVICWSAWPVEKIQCNLLIGLTCIYVLIKEQFWCNLLISMTCGKDSM